MCLAIPGQVVEIERNEDVATVDVSGVRRKVNIRLVVDDGLNIGDWVLIHVGFAMRKIDAQHAQEQLTLLAMLGEGEVALDEVRGYETAEPETPGSGGKGSP
jgi:hydrogenase expression/formation protein HypC